MHFHQKSEHSTPWRFHDIAVLSQQFFHLVLHFTSIVTKINFEKVGLNLLEKRPIIKNFLAFYFVLTTTLTKTLTESNKDAANFWNFVCSLATLAKFQKE